MFLIIWLNFSRSQTDSSYVPSEHEEISDNSDMNLSDCPEKEGDDEEEDDDDDEDDQ